MTPPTKVKLVGGNFQDSEGNLLAFGYLEMKLNQDGNISGVGNIASGITIKILLDGSASIFGTSALNLSAVANAVAGTAVYTGTISGGDNNAYAGLTFVVAGFSTSANNGTFICSASTATTLTLLNASASAESHVANATADQAIWGDDQMLPPNAYYRVTGFTSQGQPAWGPNNQQVNGNGGTFDIGTWVPNEVISWTPPLQPLLLETNGVENADQFVLNFEDTASVTWAVDGSGNLQATGIGVDLQVNSVDNASQTKLNFEDTATVTWASTAGGVIKATVPGGSIVPNAPFMLGAGNFALGSIPQISDLVAITPAANVVSFFKFYSPTPLVFSKLVVSPYSGYDATVSILIGFYDATGTLAVQAATLTGNSTSIIQANISVNLPAGTYFLAVSGSVGLAMAGIPFTTGTDSTAKQIINDNTVKFGTAANPSVGTSLPATLGALTGMTSAVANTPAIMFET